MRYGLGSKWSREYPMRRIHVAGVDIDGNMHSLYQTAVYYINKYGNSNVRSSVLVHHSLDLETPPPQFYNDWIERFST